MLRVSVAAIFISCNLCALPGFCAEWQSKATLEKQEERAKENSKVRDPLRMAVILYHRSQWKGAIQTATQALSKPLSLGDKINMLELRSESCLNLNEYKQSLVDINEAIRLRKGVPMNRYLRRANIEVALEMHREAAKDFGVVINRKIDKSDGISTTTDDLYYRKASSLFKCGDYRKAMADYDAILKIDPDSEEAFKLRGDCHVALGEFQLAVKDYIKAIANDSESPGASYFARSVAYEKLGNKTQAAADKKRALDLGYVPKNEKDKPKK